jgi:vacuolar-type H+-ATPase subunit F/Vma7
MRVLVLGSRDDARGFALAGAVTRAPRDRRELVAALARVMDERPPVGLVLVSAAIAELAPRAVEAFAAKEGAPPILVLPEEKRRDRVEGGSHEIAR